MHGTIDPKICLKIFSFVWVGNFLTYIPELQLLFLGSNDRGAGGHGGVPAALYGLLRDSYSSELQRIHVIVSLLFEYLVIH